MSFWVASLLALLCLTNCAGTVPLPAEALAHNLAGAQALERGDLELAGARFDLALEYNPEFVEAVTNLGSVEMQRGNFTRARQLLLRARRLNPDFAQAHHGLGVLAERELRLGEASDHYREALRVDPGFPQSRANLAHLLFEAGHYNHALEQYRKLREVAPESQQSHVGYVASLISLKRRAEAQAAIAKLSEEMRESRPMQLLRARLRLSLGDVEVAAGVFRELGAVEDETGVLALAWLGVSELSRGRTDAAIGAAQHAISLAPNQPLAAYVLAVALHELADPGAGAWRDRALRLNPDHPLLLQINRAAGSKSD